MYDDKWVHYYIQSLFTYNTHFFITQNKGTGSHQAHHKDERKTKKNTASGPQAKSQIIKCLIVT